MNTTFEIKYSDGSTRTFTATDNMEKEIISGDVFSISTLRPATGEKTPEMYVGNPMKALDRMFALRQESIDLANLFFAKSFQDAVDACIKILAEQLTSTPKEIH